MLKRTYIFTFTLFTSVSSTPLIASWPSTNSQALMLGPSGIQLTGALAGIGLILYALIRFSEKKSIAPNLIALVAGGLILRLLAITATPFLEVWDEQFHALVAKNLMAHPLTPTLFDHPVLPYDYTNWSLNHIWLHKQPLFLWQIAASLSLFGLKAWAVRVPSVLLTTLLIPICFDIAHRLYNLRAGLISAALIAVSYSVIYLTAGRMHTDHNDVAFMTYVTLSIWAFFRYTQLEIPSLKWALLIGLFAGMAVLNKWLSGLLVFGGWGLFALSNSQLQSRVFWYHLLLAIGLCSALVIPWQLWTAFKFPTEYKYEMAYNTKHFFEVLEGHGGNWFFHLNQSTLLYGINPWIFSALVLAGIVFVKPKYRLTVAGLIGVVFIFFSLAATKMIGFTVMILPLITVVIGGLVSQVIHASKTRIPSRFSKSLGILLALGILFTISQPRAYVNSFFHWPSEQASYYTTAYRAAEQFKRLSNIINEPQNTVILNTGYKHYISLMFYANVRAAYPEFPTKDEYLTLISEGLNVAYYDHGDIPLYLKTSDATALSHFNIDGN